MSELTNDRIRAMADQWLRDSLDIEYDYLLAPDTPQDARDPEHRTLTMSYGQDQAVDDLLSKNFARIQPKVDAILTEAELEVGKDTDAYRKLCDALLRAEAKFYTLAAKPFFQGSAELVREAPESAQVLLPHPAQFMAPQAATTLSEAIEKYISVKTEAGDWKKASLKAMPPILREFVELVEFKVGKDCGCGSVGRDTVRAYGTMLPKLPGGRTKLPKYRAKGLTALLKANIPEADLPSPKTIKNKYTAVRTFLTWAEDEGFLLGTVSLKRVLKDPKQTVRVGDSTVASFSPDDLTKLFHSKEYNSDAHNSAYQHWLPLLGLFTGARIEELCQLRLDDIRQDDNGIWFMDINDEDGKTVKTLAGKRQTPIHPFLINAGLLDRIDHLRKRHHSRLFPKLKLRPSTDKYSDAASSWFTRYRRDQGVADKDERGKRKVFHSFRHTFITYCKYKDVDRRMVKEMVGHEPGQLDDVTERYEDGFFITHAYEQGICKLDFDEAVDMGHIRGSRWVKEP